MTKDFSAEEERDFLSRLSGVDDDRLDLVVMEWFGARRDDAPGFAVEHARIFLREVGILNPNFANDELSQQLVDYAASRVGPEAVRFSIRYNAASEEWDRFIPE